MRFLLTAVILLFVAESALAHSGRTNSAGCHNNRKTGDYHCHGRSSSYSSGSSSRSYSSASTTTSQSRNAVQAQRNELVTEIQKHLNGLGYKAGVADGVLGNKTEQAIMKFQMDNGLAVTGKPSESLRIILRSKNNG